MPTESPIDRARILLANVQGLRDKNFLRTFLQDETLQRQSSAQGMLERIWSGFLRTPQGRTLLAVRQASNQHPEESKFLGKIREQLERGQLLRPSEREHLGELVSPPTEAGPGPELLARVADLYRALLPFRRKSRKTEILCGTMQRWLREQGRE